jgi:hypothetical protein
MEMDMVTRQRLFILSVNLEVCTRKLFFALPLILTACASTPAEVLQGGSRYVYMSTKSAKGAAECLAKESKNASANLVSDVRDGDTEGAYQITATSVTGDGGALVVYITSPSSRGARIETYLTNSVVFTGGREKFAKSMTEKCL